MLGGSPLGADPIGALADEAAALAALAAQGDSSARRRLYRIIRTIKRAIRRVGESVLLVTKDEAKEANVRVGLRLITGDVALLPGVRIGDYNLIIPADALLDLTFPAPVEGFIAYRFYGTSRERGLRIHKEPSVISVDDRDLLYVCIGQG